MYRRDLNEIIREIPNIVSSRTYIKTKLTKEGKRQFSLSGWHGWKDCWLEIIKFPSECVIRKYWSNGNLGSETYYKNGLEDGIQTHWYEDGKKRLESEYKNGKFSDGHWVMWDKKGRKVIL